MDLTPKNIIKKIFDSINVSINLETTETCKENKKEILFKDISKKYDHVWLCDPDKHDEEMKFDRLFLSADESEDPDLFFDILLEYIKTENLYKVMAESSNGSSVVLFNIPKFTNLAELQIKLDMTI